MAADDTGVYVTGTWRNLSTGSDSHSFVRKYGVDGTLLWTDMFQSASQDLSHGIAVGRSGLFVVGDTFGAIPGQTNSGHADAWIRKYTTDGTMLWTRQFGTSTADSARSVTVTQRGIYVGGTTWGLLGEQQVGRSDIFVRLFSEAGATISTYQFGSLQEDRAGGIASDEGGVYVTGMTGGTLPGQTDLGGSDAFLASLVAHLPTTNRLRNGNFEEGETAWGFHTDAKGYMRIDSPGHDGNNAAQVVISTSGRNVQLFRSGIELEPATRYRLEFYAKSDKGNDLSLYIHQHAAPYTNYGLRNFRVNLTREWKHFTIEFRTRGFANPVEDGRLRFWFARHGKPGEIYSVDAVSLHEIDSIIQASSLPAEANGIITGTVTFVTADQGSPVPLAVSLRDIESNGSEYQLQTWTDTDGTFAFVNTPFGTYEMQVHAPIGYFTPEPEQFAVDEDMHEPFNIIVTPIRDRLYLPLITR